MWLFVWLKLMLNAIMSKMFCWLYSINKELVYILHTKTKNCNAEMQLITNDLSQAIIQPKAFFH